MREWLPMRNSFLRSLVQAEEPPPGMHCSVCRELIGSWRCDDCLGRPIYCTGCCRTSHIRNPLHRVEAWSGSFFQPAWLSSAGVCIHTGHGGEVCPADAEAENSTSQTESMEAEWLRGDLDDNNCLPDEAADIPSNLFTKPEVRDKDGNPMLVVVDTSGIHHIGVRWCQCPKAEDRCLQLLKMGLYPASVKRPKTVFTFRVLDDFLIENEECKTSALSYYSKLKRTTNNAFPQVVVVCALGGRMWTGADLPIGPVPGTYASNPTMA